MQVGQRGRGGCGTNAGVPHLAAAPAGISIKSLTLAPHIEAPAAVHAVTMETLKHLPVLLPLLERTQLLEQAAGLAQAVACVLVQDCLFGQGLRPSGRLEKAVLAQQVRGSLCCFLPDAGPSSGEPWTDCAVAPPRLVPLGTTDE